MSTSRSSVGVSAPCARPAALTGPVPALPKKKGWHLVKSRGIPGRVQGIRSSTLKRPVFGPNSKVHAYCYGCRGSHRWEAVCDGPRQR